ncbi:imine reductase family protein [Phytoactinopolyspora halotolerans]|uniref:NADPH-dependent reductive aminase-like C-terminal domain-containing protein n=1 Tax=Phytoactinopolyspora halotolerans TaxID=1981512 RepID=A0A6L9SAD4_9ACTN|nr:hypothetical protein [Phytoactinopolyspora halotolerans]NEE01458.1 hypothetical protein [Phytoactinopolyspora halotolerans]
MTAQALAPHAPGSGDHRPATPPDIGREMAWLDTFWTAMVGLTHAVALGHASGTSVADLLTAAEQALEAARDAVAGMAGAVEAGTGGGTQPTVAAGVGEMERVIRAAQSYGLDASVLRSAASLADRVVNAGHGDEPITFMVTALAQSAIRPHPQALD